MRAEVAGTVLIRNAEPGDLVQPGRVLFEIARNGDTEILLPLDEKNLGVIKLGQTRGLRRRRVIRTQPFAARSASSRRASMRSKARWTSA